MKSLKLKFCILIMFFGFNVFSQNKQIVKTIANQRGFYNEEKQNFKADPIRYWEINIQITKDSIEFDDFSNSIYKVIEKIETNDDELLETYFCKDQKNVFCYFSICLDENKNKYYTIDYNNVTYFYYTKL